MVIPKELRHELGIEPGDQMSIWLEGDHVAMQPAGRADLRGRFAGFHLVDTLEAERRADRHRDA